MFQIVFNKETTVKSVDAYGKIEDVKYLAGESEYIINANVKAQKGNSVSVQVYDGSILYDVNNEDFNIEVSDVKLSELVGKNVIANAHNGNTLIGLLLADGPCFTFGSDETRYLPEQIKSFCEV